MRFAIVLFASVLLAADEPAFDVKQISDADAQKIEQTSKELDKATAELVTAMNKMEAAKKAHDEAIYNATLNFNPFTGQCPSYQSYVSAGSRKIRTVEIRGKFALITNKEESCNYLTFSTLNVGAGTTSAVTSGVH